MSLALYFGGSATYRLVDGNRDVGWVHEDSLVFDGFDSLADAERAGDAGYVALLDWLANRRRPNRHEGTTLHVAVGEDELSEWIGPGGNVLARIIRPTEGDRFIVEFTLPPRLHTAAAAQAAQRIYEAIHGIRGAIALPAQRQPTHATD
jgi:hypothetical protein